MERLSKESRKLKVPEENHVSWIIWSLIVVFIFKLNRKKEIVCFGL